MYRHICVYVYIYISIYISFKYWLTEKDILLDIAGNLLQI